MPSSQRPAVGIIGLGLIGGSLALQLNAAGYRIHAHDTCEQTRRAAAEHGIEVYDDPQLALRALPADAVLFIATPLAAAIELMPLIAEHTDPSVTVSDVVSVKCAVLDAARQASLAERYVGAHPMAGTAHSGFAAADIDLLREATWVVTLEESTDLARWLQVCDIALVSGARVVASDAEWHDHAAAWISHLPHVLAELLASNVEPRSLAGTLAAGSFRDGTRVAATRAELVDAMLIGNRRMLTEALEGFLDQLEHATLDIRDGQAPLRFVRHGYDNRIEWEQRRAVDAPRQTVTISTSADDVREQLLELGTSGGFVVSHDSGVLTALT